MLFDKITLEAFLANINLFRFIRNVIKKKTHLTALGSFAIKYIIKFKVKTQTSPYSRFPAQKNQLQEEKGSSTNPFPNTTAKQLPKMSKGGQAQKRAPLVTCSGLFQRCATALLREGTAQGPCSNTCTA